MKTTLICRDEAWLYDKNADVAVPFELISYAEGVAVRYYPAAQDIVDEFIRIFGENEASILSKSAVAWVCERFGDFLADHGFSLSPDSEDYYINYTLPNKKRQISADVRRLTGDETYLDLTETDISGLCGDGYIVYAAVVDNKIAAVANTGEPIFDDTSEAVEIGVDTAEEYRGRGLAKACAAALISELAELGHTAFYECASENTASMALAKSLGGAVSCKKIYIVGFRDE